MAKVNLIVDSSIVGQAKTVRKRSRSPGKPERFAGHPCMKKVYGARALDRFRGSGARYWGYKLGGYGPNYGDFDYLNYSDWNKSQPYLFATLDVHNAENLIGFKINNISRQTDNVASPGANFPGVDATTLVNLAAYEALPQALSMYFGSSMPLTIEPAMVFRTNPANINDYGHRGNKTYSTDHNMSALNTIKVKGDVDTWHAGSSYQQLTDADPLWTISTNSTWKTYALGTDYNSHGIMKWPESLPADAYPGFLPPGSFPFYDHAHVFWSPVSAPAADTGAGGMKVASIEATYYMFAKHYENAIGEVDERLLPNPYILFNGVDAGPDNSDPETVPLISRVLELYEQVQCLDGAFRLPTSRDQINTTMNVETDATGNPINAGYGDNNKTYLQQYYSAVANVDMQASGIGDALKLAEHIGYARDFVANNFANYNSQVNLPFGINIEFDTRIGDPKKLVTAIEEIPGAHDFLLANIMMMNISQTPDSFAADPDAFPGWSLKGNVDGAQGLVRIYRGEELFGVSGSFHAKLSSTAAPIEHYGFGLASWGSQQTNGPWDNKGPYNLKMLDLPAAMAYALRTKNSDGHTPTVPPLLVGPTKNYGMAFGKGMLVGRHYLAHGPSRIDRLYSATECIPDALLIDMPAFWDLCRALERVIDEERRTYTQILDGDLAYCETIAFRIAKHKVLSDGAVQARPIQNFYLPNIGNATAGNEDTLMTKLKYIDTQVKYGQKYVYKVYAYNLVIGDEYNYKGARVEDLGNTDPADTTTWSEGITIDAHQFTSVKIIEAPYYTYEPVEVRDLPPVFPEVEVVPFRGVNNKIRLLFQTQGVKYAFDPDSFIISAGDTENYDRQRTFQGRPAGPLVFGSDDTEITFEIYRTTERPTSYRSFEGMMLDSVAGVTPDGARAVNIGYDDDIKPNTKYYYTFRTIDYHGSLSIPSPIYQVEIVDDNGRMYPIVDIFYFDSSPLRSAETTAPFRRYLHLSPTLSQMTVNQTELEGREGTLDPTDAPGIGLLGVLNDGVWSKPVADAGNAPTAQKTFKIRLTSKQTGKKIDLNLQFVETSSPNPDGLD